MDTIIVNITDTNDVITINVTDIPEQITIELSDCISHIYVDGVTIIGDGSYSNPLQSIGTGDMNASVYDPTNIAADAFDYNNFYNTPYIPTQTSDLTNDGQDGINPFITLLDIPAQLQSDWNQSDNTQADYIKNKPSIPTNTSDLTNDGADGVNPFITLLDLPPLTGYVPYSGATQDVDLGEWELKAGQIELDQTPTGTAGVAVTQWNNTHGITETTLKGGSVILKNGVDLVARVVNKVTPNTTLTKAAYQVVKVSGAQGQRLAVGLAQANNDNNSADTLGLAIETIPTNQEGFVMTVGQLEEINTTGSLQGETWTDGDVLYLSPTTAGRITNIKPNGSIGHIVVLGYVEYAHAIHGKIYVKIMNGWELDELHNVYINTGTLANNDVLTYESATQLWKNKTVATALGYTPVSTSRTISTTSPLSGGGDLTTDRTLSISQANGTTNGYLSSTDWTTFNNKQNVITTGTTAQYFRGDLSLATFPTNVSSFTNDSGYITSSALSPYLPKAGGTMTGAFIESVIALTDAANISVDATLGNIFTVTLGGNRTLSNPTGAVNGQRLTFRVRQDGVGGRTLAFDTKFRFGNDLTSITLSTGINKTDYIGVIYNSADDKFDIVAVMKGY